MAAKPRMCHQFGLALGAFAGFIHLVWSVLVGLGLAQAWVDFASRMHMVKSVTTVMPFSLQTAAGLVIMTAICGYIMGYVLGTIWTAVQKKA